MIAESQVLSSEDSSLTPDLSIYSTMLPRPVASTQGLSLEEAKHYIAELLDLRPMIRRLVEIDGKTLYWAQTAAHQYRRYLYIKKKYGLHLVLPPSVEIDQVWHTHILFTRDYIAFCDKVFGEYAHHVPHLGLEARTQAELEQHFAITQALHIQEYGEPFYTVSKSVWKAKLLDKVEQYFNRGSSMSMTREVIL